MLILMDAIYEHPSLQLHVTDQQRDRAENWLQEAFADGRITETEFDRRIGQVISAVTRKDLNEAFFGLVRVPMGSQALGVHPAYQPIIRPEVKQQAGRGVAAFAHFSALFTWILGPGLVYAASSTGTYSRREAAKAFNFQVIWALSMIAVGIAAGITHLDVFAWVLPVMWLAWLTLTIVGGAKALQGENWRNPVKQVLKFEVLSEK
jgi:uncharacterized Tic20 family protein